MNPEKLAILLKELEMTKQLVEARLKEVTMFDTRIIRYADGEEVIQIEIKVGGS